MSTASMIRVYVCEECGDLFRGADSFMQHPCAEDPNLCDDAECGCNAGQDLTCLEQEREDRDEIRFQMKGGM